MTHVTCRLTAKNRGMSSGTLRSAIEYGLPFIISLHYATSQFMIRIQRLQTNTKSHVGQGYNFNFRNCYIVAAVQRR